MRPRDRIRPAIVGCVILGLVAMSCSSGDKGGAPATSSPPATTASTKVPAPGTVTLDVSGVTDATGLVMLAVIGKSVPTRMMAAACDIVGDDPFSFSGEYRPITGDDPCTLGSEPAVLDPGSYEVIVAVLPGGARTPEQCTRAEVTVDGDVTVEVAGLGPPTDCNF